MATVFLTLTTGTHAVLNLSVLLFLAGSFLFIYRFVRFFCKRLILWRRLKNICKKRNFQLFAENRRVLLAKRDLSPCDFHIVTRNTVFSVKLFGVAGKRSKLFFREDGTYHIRNRWLPGTKQKKLPGFNFRAGYRYEWELKTPRKILLLNPTCTGVFRESRNGKHHPLNPYEQLFGMEIHTLTSLLNTIGEE